MSKSQVTNTDSHFNPMATYDALSDPVDLTLCSICYEKLKSPRLLPCSHSFCETCLCAHIVSTCEQKDVPLGFPCPLCREFVPSPGNPDETTQWAEKFPINDVLVLLMNEARDIKVCWPCKRGNEEEEATEFCVTCKEPLCKMCSKCHRKSLISMNHKICLLSEIGSCNFDSRHSRNSVCCAKHNGKQIELYCYNHKTPCCTLCFTEDHKTCSNILAVEKVVKNMQRLGQMKSLEQEIEKMKVDLEIAKKSQDDNLGALEDASDMVTKEAEQLQQKVLSHVNKLFDEHFTEIAKNTKEAKRKLEKSTIAISQRLDFLQYCLRLLKSANGTLDSEETRLNYISTLHKVKENLAKLSEYPVSEFKVNLKSEIHSSFKKTLEFTKIANISLTENSRPLPKKVNIIKAEFSRLCKCQNVMARLRGCTVLPSGDLLCVDNMSSNIMLFTVKNQVIGQPSSAFQVEPNPWEILLDDGVLYVSHDNKDTSRILRFSSDNFQALDPLQLDTGKSCTGLAIIGDVLFVVSDDRIVLKMNKNGQGSSEMIYETQSRDLRFLTAIADGMLVCSNFTDHSVIALDDLDNEIWTYKHNELKGSYGLDKDPQNNIYVAGMKSNNIHILSGEGSLLRIIGRFTNLTCINFKMNSFTCFVVSQSQTMSQVTLYEFR